MQYIYSPTFPSKLYRQPRLPISPPHHEPRQRNKKSIIPHPSAQIRQKSHIFPSKTAAPSLTAKFLESNTDMAKTFFVVIDSEGVGAVLRRVEIDVAGVAIEVDVMEPLSRVAAYLDSADETGGVVALAVVREVVDTHCMSGF